MAFTEILKTGETEKNFTWRTADLKAYYTKAYVM